MTMKQGLVIIVGSIFLCTCRAQMDRRQNDSEMLDVGVPEVDMKLRRIAGSLINAFDWEPTSGEEEVFQTWISPEGLQDMSCDSAAHGVEEVSPGVWSYSIETDRCHWLTIKQGAKRSVNAGDRVQLKVWHFDLTAPQQAIAHVGLATEHERLFIEEEAIPQEGRMLKFEAEFTHDLSEGEWIYFHLDNHGANSWHLLEIKLLIAEDIDEP